HLFNACANDQEMTVYRQGVVKLVNSLSRSSDVLRLEPIDPDQTILRINIDDLGWEEADWNAILAAYPYGAKPDSKLFTVVQQATDTPLAYVRADWLASTASQPPLYNRLLRLPATFKELQTQLDLDLEGNLQRFVAQRAGFQDSGESQNNRMIERHATRIGYLWTTYDFAGNRGKQNLFEFPTGPGGDSGFTHDLGETLFSLPNGFQGYYLSGAGGERLDKAPTTIVRDLARRDLAVTNGISCMGCHDQGVRRAKDEIRAYALANREFPRSVRDAIVALHPAPERMDQVLDGDEHRFRSALERAGVDPGLKLNGMEAINALASRYEAKVDLRLAAAEFGLKPGTLKDTASAAGSKALALMLRLDRSDVPRDVLETDFAALVRGLTDEEVLNLKDLAGGQPAAASQPQAAAGVGGRPKKPAKKAGAKKQRPQANRP
ncbi:MAG: hypothetical protein M3145_08855, partial [Pseudomonadota bacterium]|nr:hypothetical protein [Pseudomonadota bacterium]